MKKITLNATTRTEKGGRTAKRAHREGKVPAIMYGPQVHKYLYLKRLDIERIVFSPETYLIALSVEGEEKTYSTIIREIQYHPIHDYVIHVDFYAVPMDVPVTVELPVKLVGLAEGVKKGGKLVPLVRRIRVKGLINDLPSAVEVDVTPLKLGKSILVRDLPPQNFRIRMAPTVALARIEIPRALRVQQAKK